MVFKIEIGIFNMANKAQILSPNLEMQMFNNWLSPMSNNWLLGQKKGG